MNVLITGATGELGKALTRAFTQRDDTVIAMGRSPEQLKALTDEMEVTTVCIDFTNLNGIQESLLNSSVDWGKINVLINAAATDVGVGPIWEIPLDSWEMNVTVNFLSAVTLINVLVPHMIKSRHGLITNVTSIAAHTVLPCLGPYCVSKAALEHYTTCLAKELYPHRVRANSVGITIQSGVYHSHKQQKEKGGYYNNRPVHKINLPMPEDNVAPFLFLASPSGQYVSGQHIECHSAYLEW